MIHMTLRTAAIELGTECSGGNEEEFCGFSIDTRSLKPNNIFIAIQGANVDGHDFVEEAEQKGAAGALVNRLMPSPLPQLVVPDTITALGKLSKAWRKMYTLPIIAITGSNGKTTLKNMITAILIAACEDPTCVLSTQGNLNNEIGLPLTLSLLNAKHRYAVLELGMNHFGEIAYLTNLARPAVAVITNAGACHLEGVVDIAGVARAKGEIFQGLTQEGMGILNKDDMFFDYWRKELGNRQFLSFGLETDADVTGVALQVVSPTQRVLLHTPLGDLNLRLSLLGEHNLKNALAATAAALSLNITLKAIKTGLEAVKPAPGRLQLHHLLNEVKIIDDTYNANPFSLQAAIDTLISFNGKKVLVLGDMKELGVDAKAFHQIAGENIRNAGIDYLFTYGELSALAAESFGEKAFHFTEQEKLIKALLPLLYNKTTILIKGSRSMQMEKVLAGLIDPAWTET